MQGIITTGVGAFALDASVGSQTYGWFHTDPIRDYSQSLPGAINGSIYSAISSAATQYFLYGDVSLAELGITTATTTAIHLAGGGNVYYSIQEAFPVTKDYLGSIYTGVGAALGAAAFNFFM